MVIGVQQMEEIMTLLLSAPYAPFLVITLIISNKKAKKRLYIPLVHFLLSQLILLPSTLISAHCLPALHFSCLLNLISALSLIGILDWYP